MAYTVKEPYNLSPRIRWLRDYYFKGADRAWNNEFLPFTTGNDWDELFDEISFYIVPETHSFLQTMSKSFPQNAVTITPPPDFFKKKSGRAARLVCERGHGEVCAL